MEFLKKLYNGKLPLEQTLWRYSILPWILLYFAIQLKIFLDISNEKFELLIFYILVLFNYISWTGLDKIITDSLFLIVIKIVRFGLLMITLIAGPLALLFIFSGYKG
ncbi:hypothetical protein KKC13_10995 [bacterium]|nr:hypothetical protein [bacterium]MBU1958178.1 hypothetical protein [bacterium]